MSNIERMKYCIDGEWKESVVDECMAITDSGTGEAIAEVPCCTEDEATMQ